MLNPQGELVLQKFTYGTAISLANLVSFTYTLNLANVSVTPTNVTSLYGILGETAGSYLFVIQFLQDGLTYQFGSDVQGDWCYGLAGTCSDGGGSIGIDHGIDCEFSPAIVGSTPEPGSLGFMAMGFAGVASAVRRRVRG